jgi:hypothetical protein
VDAEQSGSACNVAAGGPERCHDGVAFRFGLDLGQRPRGHFLAHVGGITQEICRYVFGAQQFTTRQGDAMFQDILQFANISRPAVGAQDLQEFRRKTALWFARFGGEVRQEMFGQGRGLPVVREAAGCVWE